jgi:DNA-binding MarR family transcriptional regulator
MNENKIDKINKRWKWIFHGLKKRARPILDELGLTKVDGNILLALQKDDGITKAALANSLSFQPSSLTRSLNRLISLKMVKRVVDQGDRRFITLSLTDSGRNMVERYNQAMRKPWQELLAGLNKHEIESLELVLEKITLNIKTSDDT